MNAREVLEAEREECDDKLCRNTWPDSPFLLGDRPCEHHSGVIKGIELAERADLERVETLVESLKSKHNEVGGHGSWRAGYRAAMVWAVDEIEAIRAAFPEVKEG